MMIRHSAALVAAAIALAPVAARAADGTFDKTLQVNGQVMLSVATGSGYIHVSPGSNTEVHIVGHVHANGWGFGSSADDRVHAVTSNPPIEQTGNIVTIGRHTDWIHNVSIDYDITVPHGTQLETTSGSGDLRLTDVGGPLKAQTGSGSIQASGATGIVVLQTGSGDIRSDMHAAQDVKAQTGSGGIHLQGVAGSLYAQTGSGDVEVAGTVTLGWKIHTGSGSVTLNTGGSRFTLDATTGSGDVHSDPPITTHGSLERHHVQGDINGGGPTVSIVTGSGDVRIH
jgi:Putative adhesin